MELNRRWLASGLTAAALAAAVGGVALAQSSPTDDTADHDEVEMSGPDDEAEDGDEDAVEGEDVPITDAAALERASTAALDWLETEKGLRGRVSATEVGDEESYYEIEVTLDDGRQVDVQLDEQFHVVGLD